MRLVQFCWILTEINGIYYASVAADVLISVLCVIVKTNSVFASSIPLPRFRFAELHKPKRMKRANIKHWNSINGKCCLLFSSEIIFFYIFSAVRFERELLPQGLYEKTIWGFQPAERKWFGKCAVSVYSRSTRISNCPQVFNLIWKFSLASRENLPWFPRDLLSWWHHSWSSPANNENAAAETLKIFRSLVSFIFSNRLENPWNAMAKCHLIPSSCFNPISTSAIISNIQINCDSSSEILLVVMYWVSCRNKQTEKFIIEWT